MNNKFIPPGPETGQHSQPKVRITPDMMKNFKTLTCDCGGMLFETGVILKIISPIVSPTGQEETYPLEVIICKKCGKVPSDFDAGGILPPEVLSKKRWSPQDHRNDDYITQSTKDELS